MSPGAVGPGGLAVQPAVRGPAGRFFFDHTIWEYPQGRVAAGYLALAVLATLVLYYVYYVQIRGDAQHLGRLPHELLLLHRHHRGLQSPWRIRLVAGQPDGPSGAYQRCHLRPAHRRAAHRHRHPVVQQSVDLLIIICLIGIVEGGILVATPALVRDFSPQLGRASAMGFWTIGPVAGSLITSLVALHTLDHFGQTHWKSQFVISGSPPWSSSSSRSSL